MIYFSDFMAVVNENDFRLATQGDDEARKRVAESLDGVDLYFHMGPRFDGGVGVTLADLICHEIIPRITLHKSE